MPTATHPARKWSPTTLQGTTTSQSGLPKTMRTGWRCCRLCTLAQFSNGKHPSSADSLLTMLMTHFKAVSGLWFVTLSLVRWEGSAGFWGVPWMQKCLEDSTLLYLGQVWHPTSRERLLYILRRDFCGLSGEENLDEKNVSGFFFLSFFFLR